MICNLCSYIISKKNSFFYSFNKIKYYQCKNCDLVFQDTTKKINLSSVFDDAYFNLHYSKKNLEFIKRLKQYQIDFKFINKFYKDNLKKKILDYGCGNGIFLSYFKSKKFGFDINPAKYSNKIHILNKKEMFAKKYDLIIFRGVIHHAPDVFNLLPKLFKCVKKNGFISVLATPNI
jgi:2-polyprenyl-3-methyl-5-hydroxy-6-metoxy-1,4-benzoquinol methylase